MTATITTLAEDKVALETQIASVATLKLALDSSLKDLFEGKEVDLALLSAAQQAWAAENANVELAKAAYRTKAEASLTGTKTVYDGAKVAFDNAVNLFRAKGEGVDTLLPLKAEADRAKAEYEAARTALGLGSLNGSANGTARTGQGGWRGINADGNRGITGESVAHAAATGSSGKNAYVLRLDKGGRLLRHFPSEHVYDAVIAALRGSEDQGRAFVALNALQATRTPASKGRIAVYCDRTVARILRPTFAALANDPSDKAVANSCRRHLARVDEYLALSTEQTIAQSGSADAPDGDSDADDQAE